MEGELLLGSFQQSSNYSIPGLKYRLLMKNIIHFPLENETPHSLVSRIHDHLKTDPVPHKLFDIKQKSLYVLHWALSTVFVLLGFQWLFLSLWTTREESCKIDRRKWIRCAAPPPPTYISVPGGIQAFLTFRILACKWKGLLFSSCFASCLCPLPQLHQ